MNAWKNECMNECNSGVRTEILTLCWKDSTFLDQLFGNSSLQYVNNVGQMLPVFCDAFLYPLKTSENHLRWSVMQKQLAASAVNCFRKKTHFRWFSDVSWGYRNALWNTEKYWNKCEQWNEIGLRWMAFCLKSNFLRQDFLADMILKGRNKRVSA